MNATFLVTVATSDTDFLTLSQEIQDILEKAGLDIQQVHKWAGKNTGLPVTAPLLQPTPPPTNG